MRPTQPSALSVFCNLWSRVVYKSGSLTGNTRLGNPGCYSTHFLLKLFRSMNDKDHTGEKLKGTCTISGLLFYKEHREPGNRMPSHCCNLGTVDQHKTEYMYSSHLFIYVFIIHLLRQLKDGWDGLLTICNRMSPHVSDSYPYPKFLVL